MPRLVNDVLPEVVHKAPVGIPTVAAPTPRNRGELLYSVLRAPEQQGSLAVGIGLRLESEGVNVLLGCVAAGRKAFSTLRRIDGNAWFEKPRPIAASFDALHELEPVPKRVTRITSVVSVEWRVQDNIDVGLLEPSLQRWQRRDEERRMGLTRGSEVWIHPEMDLDAVKGKPAASAASQVNRLFHRSEPEDAAVELLRQVFSSGRHRELDVVNRTECESVRGHAIGSCRLIGAHRREGQGFLSTSRNVTTSAP
jgi:hypothetical protein